MTNEELQQAIAWFENRLSSAIMPGAREMFGIALSALREKREREKGCELCKNPVKWDAYYGYEFPYVYCSALVNPDRKIKVHACPNCGREIRPKGDLDNG